MTTTYPLVRRLLGALGADWRADRPDPLDYLADQVRADDAAAVAAELDELCARAGSEYDYVRVLVESGARFSPYGDFGTAEAFVRRLQERLSLAAPDRAVAEPAAPAATEPASPAAGPSTGRPADERLPACPGLGQLLVMSYARGCTTYSQVLDHVGLRLGRLVELGAVDPGAVVAELAELFEEGQTEADFATVTSRSGATLTPDTGCPTTGDFLRALQLRLIDSGAASPELATNPEAVVDGTLAAFKRGDLHPAMTGLARMYGVPELGCTTFPAFRARVAELLDHVLPQDVAAFVDDATLGAETVADEAGWMRARWMRSAVELVLTAFADRAAAAYVDRDEVAQMDELLGAPTCRFGVPAGASVPHFANSHWWWRQVPQPTRGAHRAGLPMHPRWYPGIGAWRVKVPAGGATGDEVGTAADLSRRLMEASVAAFGDVLRASAATVMVQVLDDEGSVCWADASMTAGVRDGRLVVTDPDLAEAPAGTQVITSGTVRGSFGRGAHRAEWSVELLRGLDDDGRETTTGGAAVFTLDAAPDPEAGGPPELLAADAETLAEALRGWERHLGAELCGWRSSCRPTLVGRYGWGGEVFGAGSEPARPLLQGVSAHLWAGQLRLGMVGLCRVYTGCLLDGIDMRVWREDWIAALVDAGRDAVEGMLSELVDETRRLDYSRWHLLCATRSGLQFAGEQLEDERLAGSLPLDAIRPFDDAMRSFGRRFGPVPRAHVPGGHRDDNPLWETHPWWRYPVDSATELPVDLDGLAEALWAELDRPERQRRTKAPTRSLATVLRSVRSVCDGEVAGFSERLATRISAQVADSWDLGAALTDEVLRYFRPIAAGDEWPLPVPGGDRA